jgi:hypothetical protein
MWILRTQTTWQHVESECTYHAPTSLMTWWWWWLLISRLETLGDNAISSFIHLSSTQLQSFCVLRKLSTRQAIIALMPVHFIQLIGDHTIWLGMEMNVDGRLLIRIRKFWFGAALCGALLVWWASFENF